MFGLGWFPLVKPKPAKPVGCEGCLYLHSKDKAAWRCICDCHLSAAQHEEEEERHDDPPNYDYDHG